MPDGGRRRGTRAGRRVATRSSARPTGAHLPVAVDDRERRVRVARAPRSEPTSRAAGSTVRRRSTTIRSRVARGDPDHQRGDRREAEHLDRRLRPRWTGGRTPRPRWRRCRVRADHRPMPMNSSIATASGRRDGVDPPGRDDVDGEIGERAGRHAVADQALVAHGPVPQHQAARPVGVDQLREPRRQVHRRHQGPQQPQRPDGRPVVDCGTVRSDVGGGRRATAPGRCRRAPPPRAGTAGTPGCGGSGSATGTGCRRRRRSVSGATSRVCQPRPSATAAPPPVQTSATCTPPGISGRNVNHGALNRSRYVMPRSESARNGARWTTTTGPRTMRSRASARIEPGRSKTSSNGRRPGPIAGGAGRGERRHRPPRERRCAAPRCSGPRVLR